MHPALALVPSIPGGSLLYLGLALTVLILLAIYVWGIAAAVGAAGRQQGGGQGWVIGIGLLMGWVVLGILSVVGLAIYRHGKAAPAPARIYSATPRVVRGLYKPFSITVPGGWNVYPHPLEKADIRISCEGLYLEIFSRAKTGTSIEAAERWRTNLNQLSERCDLGDFSPVQIDGATFLRYPARTRRKGSTDDYERIYYVYAGPEGTYEMVGWRLKAWQAGDEDTLNGIAASFRFPATRSGTSGAHRVPVSPTPTLWPAGDRADASR